MEIFFTQSTNFILGPIAKVLGMLMDVIFNFLSLIGINNIGICIIVFTIVIYTILLPLNIKQQKFQKLSSIMSPELQAIQKKYKNKKDQNSQLKMQEEIKLVYEKYGTSQMAGCSGMIIQLPIMFTLFEVIRNIPAYVGKIKEPYEALANQIMSMDGYQKIMETIGAARPILIDPTKKSYEEVNTLIDVLYKFQQETWATLVSEMPSIEAIINTTQDSVRALNSFLGVNIAESPSSLLTVAWSEKDILLIILAIAFPVLSGASQWLSTKISPVQNQQGAEDNPAMNSMKTMTVIMPLFSVFIGFTMPTGLVLYWIVSAIVRVVQTIIIDKYLEKKGIDKLVEENISKVKKKMEKGGKISSKNIYEMAQKNAKNIQAQQVNDTNEEDNLEDKEKKFEEAQKKNSNAASGSLASKANMVKRFNESNKK